MRVKKRRRDTEEANRRRKTRGGISEKLKRNSPRGNDKKEWESKERGRGKDKD